MYNKLNLSKIEDAFNDFLTRRNISECEATLYIFKQLWGNTCLGYDGIGGCAMTFAYTCVFKDDRANHFEVYPGSPERLGYTVDNPSEAFFEDLKAHNMEPQYGNIKKYNKEQEE